MCTDFFLVDMPGWDTAAMAVGMVTLTMLEDMYIGKKIIHYFEAFTSVS
jgi:hypothetical protein